MEEAPIPSSFLRSLEFLSEQSVLTNMNVSRGTPPGVGSTFTLNGYPGPFTAAGVKANGFE